MYSIPEFEEITIPDKDLSIKTTRGSGPGGQARNKQENCVVAKHLPTGISVRIDGKSQLDNKKKALSILQAKVNEIHNNVNLSSLKHKDSGRSDKIRTYDYIRGFVKDHRTGKKIRIKEFMKGGLQMLI